MDRARAALYWQALLSAGFSRDRGRMLMNATRNATDPVIALRSHPRLSPAERQRLGKVDEKKLKLAMEAGVSVLEPESFPQSLTASEAHDQALFVWGELSCLFRPMVAIVGTRRATVYGKAVAQKFAESLARSGVTIVSGGAQGIDAAAHRGALEVQGSTVAVLGGGIDRVFPAVHADLFRRVRTGGGCLVSQFPVGYPSLNHNFLARNHLIAALSLAVIVVEAPSQSGALATAHAAADLNRPVFVVPGTIDRDSFRGSHDLIRHGATLVDHPDQVLEDLGIEPSPEVVAPSSSNAQRVLDALDAEPITPEALADSIGIELPELLSELTLLEIEGKVVRDGPGFALRP